MPIVINELVIKATVSDGGPRNESGASRGTALSTISKQELIAECVEAVLRILELRKQR